MKRKSMFLSIAVFVGVISTLYYNWQNQNLANASYAEFVLLREKQMQSYIDFALTVSETQNIQRLPDILRLAIEQRLFDWYQLSYQGSVLSAYPEGTEKIKFPNATSSHTVINNKVSYKTVVLAEGSSLTLGINKSPAQYYARIKEKYKLAIIQDLLVAVAIPLLVFFFFLKDILKLIRSLSSGKGIQTQRRFFLSEEEESLHRAIWGVENRIESLADQNSKLSNQVLTSLRKEIFSGKKPPYEFDCTLVRTDINGFSEMFLQGNRSALMADLKSLFSELTGIVTRYGGYVHEFVGDEMIFYFKDQEHGNSVAAALACLRDFHVFAQSQGAQTTKSALSHGTLYFSHHVTGYNLTGAVLIESVRILSEIKERNQFAVYFGEAVQAKLPSWTQSEHVGATQLKGYQQQTQLYRVTHFVHLQEGLDQALLQPADYIYFTAEKDLRTLLNSHVFSDFDVHPERIGAYFCQLQKRSPDRRSLEIKNAFMESLRQFLMKKKTTPFAHTLLALPFFVGEQAILAADQILLQQAMPLLAAKGQRSLLRSLIQMKTKGIAYDLFRFQSPLAQMYAVVFRNLHQLKKKDLDLLKKWLHSPSLKERHMGTWACMRLIRHWTQQDPVHLEVQGSKLLDLQKEIQRRYRPLSKAS